MAYVLFGAAVVAFYALIAVTKRHFLSGRKRVETMHHEIAAHELRSRG